MAMKVIGASSRAVLAAASTSPFGPLAFVGRCKKGVACGAAMAWPLRATNKDGGDLREAP
jgi:hypothetical protein